jgi:carbamate kinase
VIDKDLATSLLARELGADVYIMATDVDGVYADWGTPNQRRLDGISPAELRSFDFPAGSMGPKVDAAAEFVEATGGRAVIGSLEQIDGLVAGTAGTNVVVAPASVTSPSTSQE